MAALRTFDSEDDYTDVEQREGSWAFYRVARHRARLKRRLDCGDVIDGGEPYRYQVGKLAGAASLFQRLDCEPCARIDDAF